MKAYQSQQQRFELKYLVDEPTALAIRDLLSEYLSLDAFCRDQPNYSYANHSLYCDQVIATLKFGGRFPDWFWHFQRLFRLQPCNPAKYATSVSMLEKRRDPTGIGYPGTIAHAISQTVFGLA